MTDPRKKVYLGDGVYAVCDELGDLVLTTENGVSVTNTIVLEPSVMSALIQWIESVSQEEE